MFHFLGTSWSDRIPINVRNGSLRFNSSRHASITGWRSTVWSSSVPQSGRTG